MKVETKHILHLKSIFHWALLFTAYLKYILVRNKYRETSFVMSTYILHNALSYIGI